MKNITSIIIRYSLILSLFLLGKSIKANVASDYFFSRYNSSYISIDSTAGVNYITSLRTGTWDDGNAGMFPIGFPFNYDGIARDSFAIGTNGLMGFSYDITALAYYTAPLRSNILAPLGLDLYGILSPAKMMYKVSGVSPNRMLTIEWKDFTRCCSGVGKYNFQIKLYESSDRIEFCYGKVEVPLAGTATVGISGNVAVDTANTHMRTNSSSWIFSTRGTSSSSMNIAPTNIPDSGLVYRFERDSFNLPKIISGTLFYDANNNCIKDSFEVGIPNQPVQLIPGDYTTFTNANGNYYFLLDSAGNYLISPLLIDTNLRIICPAADTLLVHVDSVIANVNFPLDAYIRCPVLEINANQSPVARCRRNSVLLEYSNIGVDTARNLEIKFTIDPELIFLSSIPTWSRIDSSVYVYEIDKLAPFQTAIIQILDSARCDAMVGQTACIEARIFADNLCTNIDSSWDSSSISTFAYCDSSGTNDTIFYMIYNKSMRDMRDSSTYRIYEDDLLVLNRRFILSANGQMQISIPANGKTFRLEADQVAFHPGNSIPRSFAELCGPAPYSLNEIIPIPLDDRDPWIDISCREILASFDPNAKSSSPAGIGADHKIARGQELEYLIEFQNTGTAEALKVVLIDTIDITKLQINTLQMQMSSHAYTLDILNGSVLRWTFDPIFLADSATNEAASHGFVKFTMLPVVGLPDMTRINNFVDIYFDENAPIRTNIHFVTIVDEPNTLPLPIIVNKTSVNNRCADQSIASANVDILRGTGHYTVLWEDGSTTTSRTNLPAGVYRYTVTDWYGYVVSDSIVITTPGDFNILDSVQNKLCNTINNGSISLNISGATPTYTYRWNDGVGSKDRTGLNAGNYSIIITDANGCKDSMNFTITEPDSFSVSDSMEHLKCYNQNNGSISLNVSGATPSYSYLWNDGNLNRDRSFLAAGIYSLTITDANHCEYSETYTIVEPDDFTVTELIDNVKCYGNANATIDITVSGATPAYNYSWNDMIVTEDRTSLAAGTYTVTITDANACQTVVLYTITEPDQLLINESHTDASSSAASDGSIDITVNGGTIPYSYFWNTSDTGEDLTALQANTYTITVEDANGCISTMMITISQPDNIGANSFSNQVQVFPNPSSEFIRVTATNIDLTKIVLYDQLGKEVYKRGDLLESPIAIPIKHLSDGIYNLSISHENKTVTYKVLIQH